MAATKTNQNPMKEISIEKVTLNIGAGKNEDLLAKGLKLFQKLAPNAPVKTITQKRIPGWGLRPGLVIGCKVTIRKDASTLLKRLLAAKANTLSPKNFDDRGNFAFGVPEYIDIQGLEYDPDLKILGLEVAVTLQRRGYGIKRRSVRPAIVGKKHQITTEEAINYVKQLGVKVE
ncbi:50S ribosomal protein L5 [Candidatus Woesearchaeota archaeon]|nr:50S ribosomal protein L5 [Candidatus Woesearchaeota archaeon]